MSYPALIFWVLIVWSVTANHRTVLLLLFASTPFLSLALLPPGMIGMSILPQSMFAVVLIFKVLAPHLMPLSPKLLTALQLRYLGYLALFLMVGTVATVILPRLFMDQVIVVPMREEQATDFLSPTVSNFTQFGYVTLSVATVFAVSLMADEPSFTKTLLKGTLIAGIICIVTGVIDLVARSTGMESLLDPFRNAGYAYLTMDEVSGQQRVAGFTPEASAYGPLCVSFAALILLLRPLFAEGRQRKLATMIGVCLVVFAELSTSSTAYGGLAVLGLVYLANWVRRAAFASPLGQRGLLSEFLLLLSAVPAVMFVLITRADVLDPLLDLIDTVLFSKTTSSSYVERSYLNTMAWQTVGPTWGLGVGFGSTRASNWVAAIVSSTGLIGAALMAIFLIQTFARRPWSPTPGSNELIVGLKLSLAPILVMAGVSLPGADFGIATGVVFGAITGVAAFGTRRSWLVPPPTPEIDRGSNDIGSLEPRWRWGPIHRTLRGANLTSSRRHLHSVIRKGHAQQ
jgi:hypothetical protein